MEKKEKALKEKVRHYKSLTQKALKKAKICVPKNSALYLIAKDFHSMAENYFKDAKHFEKQGQLATALASYSYAHAWLDAGARLGVFDVKNDYQLFTLFK